MFDDSQTNQAGQTQQTDNTGQAPSMGIGMNPNPTVIGPTDSTPDAPTAPQVVTPAAASDHAGQVSNDPLSGSAPAVNSALDEIKQQALAQLSPLVSQLDQTPEERYKTIMMMIQASDNQDLITQAYAAAQEITDEKAKAEALLNIVNEINYFTQQKTQ
jgi:hypothetical protein